MELTQAILMVLGIYVGIPVALACVAGAIRAYALSKRPTLAVEEEQTFAEAETKA